MHPDGTPFVTQQLIDEKSLAIGDGYRAKNVELDIVGIPFARAGNINNGFHFEDADCFPEESLHKVGDKISQPGDVVFTSKGTVGRFAYVRPTTPRFVFSPQLCYWRSLDPETIDSRYLYYWMHGEEFWTQAAGVKSQTDMADYVSLRDQRRMTITLPSIAQQRALAQTLGSLDDKIELNRQMNYTLEAMARTLFKSWFVDFDPVVAKADTCKPPLLTDSVAALFPDKFVDSELGPIPEGWRLLRVKDVAELCYGKSLTAAKRVPGEIPVFGSDGQVGWHNTPLVKGPGVIIGRKGNAGKVNWSETDFFPIDTTYYVTSQEDYSIRFLYHLLRETDFIAMSGDSAVPGLNRDLAYSLDVVVPPLGLAAKFETFVEPIQCRLHSNNREASTLAALRDLLLPKLLSGEIRLKQAEKVVEQVV